jgi:hypothetical protein
MASQIQLRRDTAANWTSANPTLAQGEIGFESNTGKMKIGIGSTAWTSLGYFAGAIADISGLQSALDGKQAIVSGVSDTEIGYLDGVTSAIQTQLNGKVDEVNGAVTTASTSATVVRNITLSTSTPSGGMDGDVWLQYTA